MRLLPLTFLYCLLGFFSGDSSLEYQPSSSAKSVKSVTANLGTTAIAKPREAGILFQSQDGGQTWQDISAGLPENGLPEDFFAGESGVYLRVKNEMYRTKSNLTTPVWEKENGLDPRSTSIAFNHSGVIAYSYEGQIYQKKPFTGVWLPVYASLKKSSVRGTFETADGAVFVGSDNGLYKSTDKGQTWKQVLNEGWVTNLVESEGVLVGTGEKGIMRSTDNGEHWEWVINEGGVGIAIERINGGFAAISYNKSSQSRRIRMSLDNGKTWKAIDEGIPASLSISSIKQIGNYLICGHPDGIFRSSDMGKTWNIVHASNGSAFAKYANIWDMGSTGDNKKVFKVCVSGNVLYAIAINAGC